MYRKKQNERKLKVNSFMNGKGGFTLAELSVVLALIVVLAAMMTTFSVLMGNQSKEGKAEYQFLVDSAKLRDTLTEWFAENDREGVEFVVNKGELTLEGGDGKVAFSNGVMTLADKKLENIQTVEGISFGTNGKLIKCTLWRYNAGGKLIENSFVISLRVTSAVEVTDE